MPIVAKTFSATMGVTAAMVAVRSPLAAVALIGVPLALVTLVVACPWNTPFDRVSKLLKLWLAKPVRRRPRPRRRHM
jgi:hypothetical protein